MFCALIQMRVVTSKLELRTATDMCKRFNASVSNPEKANHTRIYKEREPSDPLYCTDGGKRDPYDYKRSLEIFNYLRWLIDLSPVKYTEDKKTIDEMLKGVMYLRNRKTCDTPEGRRAISSSYTDFGSYETVLSVDMQHILLNAGQENLQGRRRLIDPALPELAADAIGGVSAIRIKNFNTPAPKEYKNPEMIAYPTPGYFPVHGSPYAYPAYWSLTLRDYDDLPQDAVGDVKCDGKSIVQKFSIQNKTSSIPKGAFVFTVQRPKAFQKCEVSIKSKELDTEWRYWTMLVDCDKPMPVPARTPFPENVKIVDANVVATLTGGSITGLVFGFIIAVGVGVVIGIFVGKKFFTVDSDIKNAALV